jgi:hypothetical protein
MHVKATVKYYYLPTTVETIKNINNIKCEQGCGQWELSYIVGLAIKWDNHFGKCTCRNTKSEG